MSVWILAPDGTTQCCDCRPNVCAPCACPNATLECDSIGASISKSTCKRHEWSNVSSPPKYYNNVALSGYFDTTCCLGLTSTNTTISGIVGNGKPPVCTQTSVGRCNVHVTGTTVTDCDTLISDTNSNVNSVDASGATPPSCVVNCGYNASNTNTVATFTPTTGGGCNCIGIMTETLIDEYTTAQLKSDTVDALPSYPNSFGGTCSSLADLTSDEITYSIRRFKYRFALPNLAGHANYRIDWMEGSNAMNYVWDGMANVTPVYGPVLEPATNGTIQITNVNYSCP